MAAFFGKAVGAVKFRMNFWIVDRAVTRAVRREFGAR